MLLAGKIIPRSALAVGDLLGTGAFGEVRAATWDGRHIAIKVLDTRRMDEVRLSVGCLKRGG